jgi:hypothetical protein
MTRQGKGLAEMRDFIDNKYPKYGLGADTPRSLMKICTLWPVPLRPACLKLPTNI